MTWTTRRLGDLVEESGGAIQTGPFGSQLHRSDYAESGTPVVMPQDIVSDRFSRAKIAFVPDSVVQKLSRHRLLEGDVVYPRRGDLNKRALVREGEEGWLCGTGCIRVRLGSAPVTPSYLYNFLKLSHVVKFIENKAVGATMLNLNTSILASIEVVYPDLAVQRRIADILSAYDDLIENNNRRMALLEESIHLLYREWFVYLRFPGYERVEVVDGVPEGWSREPANSSIAFNPRTSVPKDTSRPYVPMGSLSTTSMRIADVEERVPRGGAKFRNGDTLLARITPCLENGKTGFVQFMDSADEAASGSTEFIVMRGQTVPSSWVYCLARSPEFRQEAINRMSGSDGRQRVDWKSLSAVEVLRPSSSVTAEFDTVAREVFKQVRLLNKHNDKLREARDLLLPRLMDGRIPV